MGPTDFAQYSTVSGLDGLEIISARWVEHSFTPHIHDFYAVSLNYAGRGAFHWALRDAVPGMCNLIAPGESEQRRAENVSALSSGAVEK
jgi:hypothetical protein